jgi:hypothetical protein
VLEVDAQMISIAATEIQNRRSRLTPDELFDPIADIEVCKLLVGSDSYLKLVELFLIAEIHDAPFSE